MDNDLRRTKEKLAIIHSTTAPVIQMLLDLMKVIGEDSDNHTFYGEQDMLGFVTSLENKYKQKIYDKTPKRPRQQKLFR